MIDLLISWLVLSGAFWVTAQVVSGFELPDFRGAVLAAAAFGVVHWLIGRALFVFFGIATLGLGFLLAFVTRWLVDAVLLKITDAVSDSLRIKNFGTALVAALSISLVGTVGEMLARAIVH